MAAYVQVNVMTPGYIPGKSQANIYGLKKSEKNHENSQFLLNFEISEKKIK